MYRHRDSVESVFFGFWSVAIISNVADTSFLKAALTAIFKADTVFWAFRPGDGLQITRSGGVGGVKVCFLRLPLSRDFLSSLLVST